MSKITLVTGNLDDCIYVDGVKAFTSGTPITFHEVVVCLKEVYDLHSPINSLEVKVYNTDWLYSVGPFPKYLKDVLLEENLNETR